MVTRSATSQLETEFGVFDIHVYRESRGVEHVALVKSWDDIPLVRLHSKCATGDIFGSVYCDCRLQLHEALHKIQQQGGVLVYLEQEGRGLGLTHKIKAYELQRKGMDTVEADETMGEGIDERSYDLAAEILRDLQIDELQLLTNNPVKLQALEMEGFIVTRQQHQVPAQSERGKRYQCAKAKKLNHLMEHDE